MLSLYDFFIIMDKYGSYIARQSIEKGDFN